MFEHRFARPLHHSAAEWRIAVRARPPRQHQAIEPLRSRIRARVECERKLTLQRLHELWRAEPKSNLVTWLSVRFSDIVHITDSATQFSPRCTVDSVALFSGGG